MLYLHLSQTHSHRHTLYRTQGLPSTSLKLGICAQHNDLWYLIPKAESDKAVQTFREDWGHGLWAFAINTGCVWSVVTWGDVLKQSPRDACLRRLYRHSLRMVAKKKKIHFSFFVREVVQQSITVKQSQQISSMITKNEHYCFWKKERETSDAFCLRQQLLYSNKYFSKGLFKKNLFFIFGDFFVVFNCFLCCFISCFLSFLLGSMINWLIHRLISQL